MSLRDHPYSDRETLKRDLITDVPAAWAFVSLQYRAPLLELLYPLAYDEQDANALLQSFLESLQHNATQALSSYKPKTDFTSFLALLLANYLAPRILEKIRVDPSKGFECFERLFGRVVLTTIKNFLRKAVDEAWRTHSDLYHDAFLYLLEDSGSRLLSFHGKGAFSAYVRTTIRNYLFDKLREGKGRRRLPQAVQHLSPLEQAAFRLMAWEGLSGYEAREQLRISEAAGVSDDDLEAAIGRIIPYIPTPAARSAEVTAPAELPEPKPDILSGLLRWQRVRSPESELLTRMRRRQLDAALESLRRAINALPEDQRAFLAARYFAETPLTPREIARRWQRPVEQVYELGRRAMASLRAQVAKAGLDGIEL